MTPLDYNNPKPAPSVNVSGRAALADLNVHSRQEALRFLKRLWNGEEVACPLCGSGLEPLHKKAKKGNCDWQCKTCGKVFRTLYLLDEINSKMRN